MARYEHDEHAMNNLYLTNKSPDNKTHVHSIFTKRTLNKHHHTELHNHNTTQHNTTQRTALQVHLQSVSINTISTTPQHHTTQQQSATIFRYLASKSCTLLLSATRSACRSNTSPCFFKSCLERFWICAFQLLRSSCARMVQYRYRRCGDDCYVVYSHMRYQ